MQLWSLEEDLVAQVGTCSLKAEILTGFLAGEVRTASLKGETRTHFFPSKQYDSVEPIGEVAFGKEHKLRVET